MHTGRVTAGPAPIAAQAAGNKAGVTAAETRISDRKKSLDDKQGKLAAKQAELDKYLIKSPVDGKVTAVGKPNGRVTPNDIVAKIARAPTLVVTLHSPAEIAPGTRVLLKVMDGADQKLSCAAATTTADGVRIVCAGDVAKPDTTVSLIGLDSSQPTPSNGTAGSGSAGGEIEMGDDGSAAGSAAKTGSAAGSAAGSGSAAKAGSAAPKAAAPARPRAAPARPQPKPPQPKPPQPKPDVPADPAAAPAAGSDTAQ